MVSFVLICRHVLRALVRHNHAEHEPAQPVREGQAAGGAVCVDEPRDRQRRGPAARAPRLPVREHQVGAVQDTRGRRQRPHAHLLQPGQGGLAVEAGRADKELEAAVVYPQRQMPLLL